MAKDENSKMHQNIIGRRGFMLVLSSPSGAGKTTIARRLIEEESGLNMSVSATTRPRRPGEVEGKDYYFVEEQTFHLITVSKFFMDI